MDYCNDNQMDRVFITAPQPTASVDERIDGLHQLIADIREHAHTLKWQAISASSQQETLPLVFAELHNALAALDLAEALVQEQQHELQAGNAAGASADDSSRCQCRTNGEMQSREQAADVAEQETDEMLLARERTARMQAEAELHEQAAFLAVAAHECKTPLQTILGQAYLIHERATRSGMFTDRDQRALTTIGTQAKRLSTQIDSLLDGGRMAAGQFSVASIPLDLVALINSVVAMLEPALQHHTLRAILPRRPLIVIGDAPRLQQVLENLINNAVKYSPQGGAITVEMQRQRDHVTISVTDQGIGIPASAYEHLFQRFYRVDHGQDQDIRGQGIGLYVVKAIVDAHVGSVAVESEEGVGSTFTISLPLAEAITNRVEQELHESSVGA